MLIDTADEALPELTAELLAVSDAAQAAATAALGRTHDCGVLRGRGFVSTKAWLKQTTRCGDRDAARLLARSRDLQRPELAATRSAWLAGRIVGAGVREISLGLVACEKKTRTDAELTALVFGECQQVLLDIAQRENADHVRAAAARILATVFPDGATADEQEAYHAQHLRLTRVGNETDVRGMLSAESDALLSTALDRIVDRWYRDGTLGPQPVLDPVTGQIDQQATDAAIEAAKNGGTGGVQRGKADHLRALALVELARQFLDEGKAGTAHGVRPHLVLTVELADLLAGRGTGTLDVPGGEAALVPVSTLARLGCDADITLAITRVLESQAGPDTVHGADGVTLVPADGDLLSTLAARLRGASREVLWLGREHRHVTPRVWRMLTVRDRHCRFPGCYADVSRCQPHHVLEWWLGGETDPGNLILLCARHHRMVHDGEWKIVARPGVSPLAADYWEFIAPPRRTRP